MNKNEKSQMATKVMLLIILDSDACVPDLEVPQAQTQSHTNDLSVSNLNARRF